MTLGLLLIVLIVPIPSEQSNLASEDLLLYSDTILLDDGGPFQYNLTFNDKTGYYGSYASEGVVIEFTIVMTSGLSLYLLGSDEYSLYSESNSTQPRWEYGSQTACEVTILLESITDYDVEVYLEVYEDITPIQVDLTFTWITNYPPKLQINACFSGGFFDRASGYVFRSNLTEQQGFALSFYTDSLKTWTAGRYSRGQFIEFPDGNYRLELSVYNEFNELEINIFPFQKTTQQNSAIILTSLVWVLVIALVVEIMRRNILPSRDV